MVTAEIIPANETQRVQALQRYDILDTPADGAFDNVTKLAAKLFGVPISIVSLVDTDRIWFKSHHGVDVQQIDRVPGLCASGILGNAPYVLNDAAIDPRSLANPLVAGEFGLRFYVGVPLQTSDNYNLGMLCCLGFQPREVTASELEDLKCLGQLVMDQMEVRRQARYIDELAQEVKQTQERMSLAVQAGKVGIWGLDVARQKIDWDAQMYALYGQSQSSFGDTTNDWLALIDAEDRDRVKASWQASIDGADSFESEFKIKAPDGSTRYIRSLAQFFSDNGKSARLLGTNWDVTEERLASVALRQAKDLAEAAERAKSSFLANMSHELRTPLNAIIGFAEMMKYDPNLNKTNAEYVGIINQSGSHLLSLINEVLDMAKVESGRIELHNKDIELGSFLDAVAAMIAIRAERKDLRLTKDLAADLPPFIKTDEQKLRQILLNLLSNAVKFTDSGEVRMQVRFQAAATATQGELQVEISDTGPGMNPEELSKLFTPFQQGHAGYKSQEGTGLGLVLSKKFIELMGGTIAVRSIVGSGSTFAFSIKVETAESGQIAEDQLEVTGVAPGQKKLKIMVVDDIQLNRLLLERVMSGLGYEVKTANDGREAVNLFTQFKPDLIWIDLIMPVLNGDAATAEIRKLPGGDQVKIVCVTASALVEDRDRILRSGCDEVLFKPLREPALFSLMHELLGVQFLYRTPQAKLVPQSQLLVKLDLSKIPRDWLHRFHHASINGDTDTLQVQVQQLANSYPELGLELQTLLDNLELDEINAFAERQIKAA